MNRERIIKIVSNPILLGFLLVILVVLILAICGFRITYAPSLEESWDAISACASWASVLVAGLTIYYAIQVPKKIAEKQNQIALFEKRIEVYSAIQDLCGCVAQIKDVDSSSQVLTGFKLHIGEGVDLDSQHSELKLIYKMKKIETLVIEGEFLFVEYDVELLQKMISEANSLIFETIKSVKVEKPNSNELTEKASGHKKRLCDMYHKVFPKYIDAMEAQLYMISRREITETKK